MGLYLLGVPVEVCSVSIRPAFSFLARVGIRASHHQKLPCLMRLPAPQAPCKDGLESRFKCVLTLVHLVVGQRPDARHGSALSCPRDAGAGHGSAEGLKIGPKLCFGIRICGFGASSRAPRVLPTSQACPSKKKMKHFESSPTLS